MLLDNMHLINHSHMETPFASPSLLISIIVRDPLDAMKWYSTAFGAEEMLRFHGLDGTVKDIIMNVQGSQFSITMEEPHVATLLKSPNRLEGVTSTFRLITDDALALHKRALLAGAESSAFVENMGYQGATIRDPFGFEWGIWENVKSLSGEEMQQLYYEKEKISKGLEMQVKEGQLI